MSIPAQESWPLVGQFSSIGSMGTDGSKWLCSEFQDSLVAAGSSGTAFRKCDVPIHLVCLSDAGDLYLALTCFFFFFGNHSHWFAFNFWKTVTEFSS